MSDPFQAQARLCHARHMALVTAVALMLVSPLGFPVVQA